MNIGRDPWSPRPGRAKPNFMPFRDGRSAWLIVPFVLAALSLLTAGYLSTFTPAKIIDGQRVISLQTHQTTISGALRETNIQLHPEDLVSPPLNATLNRNDTIIIQRAHLVRVRIDGQDTRVVRTQSRTGTGVINALGFTVGERDLLTVNNQLGDTLPDQPMSSTPDNSTASSAGHEPVSAEIDFKHAQELTIQEQNKPPITLLTTAATVGEALLQAGYKVYLADTVRPSPSELVKSGTHIFITRAKPVSVVVDGRRLKTRTYRTTVGDVLADLNVVLYGEDYAKPGLDAVVGDDLEIHVVRVRHEVLIEQEVIPFESQIEPDSDIELDQQALGQPGVPGVHERRTMVTFEDDAETKRELIADFIAQNPQPKITKYGTKVVVRTLNTPNGPLQYWRVMHVLATSYSASTAGVSQSATYYGRVRCGFAMRNGIVAVDPRYIPLGTNVYVDGYGVGNACDTGNAIKGKHIDLGFDDNNLQLWYRWVDVYLLTPVPANIRYNLN